MDNKNSFEGIMNPTNIARLIRFGYQDDYLKLKLKWSILDNKLWLNKKNKMTNI
jgi:hypothetical protein